MTRRVNGPTTPMLPASSIHPAWMDEAACARPEVDPEIFWLPSRVGVPRPARLVEAAPALAHCAVCPVSTLCRATGDSLPPAGRANAVFGGHFYDGKGR